MRISAILLLLLASCDRLSIDTTGGPGGPIGPGADPAAEQAPRSAALHSIAAGEDLAILHWSPADGDAGGILHEVRLAPEGVDLDNVGGLAGPSPIVAKGLAGSVMHHAQLFTSEDGGDNWRSSGPRLRFKTAPVLHVDSDAPAGGNGTAGAPLNDLTTAFLLASIGSKNVWVAEGMYPVVTAPSNGTVLTARGVSVHGGFEPTFTPELRDPRERTTLVAVDPTLNGVTTIVTVVAPAPTSDHFGTILDGLTLDGGHKAQEAVDSSSEVELRSLTTRATNRGIVLEKSTLNSPEPALVAACTSVENDLEGVLVRGSWRVDLWGCDLSRNGQEGCQFDALRCPLGTSTAFTAKADVIDCTFFGNGSDGIDIDLRGPDDLTDDLAPGGHFEVQLSNVLCAYNGGIGCLVDLDYEAFAQWSSEIRLERVEARGNGLDGVRLDLDDGVSATDATPTTTLLWACRASANLGDGFHVSSETERNQVVMAACLAMGNRGAGIGHSQGASAGNASIATSHCVVAGNQVGIEAQPLQGWHANAVAWLQPSPWPSGSSVASLPLTSAPSPFRSSPSQFLLAQSDGATVLVSGGVSLSVGGTIEWNDDGLARTITGVSGSSVSVDPPAAGTPVVLLPYPGSNVQEDFAPIPGAPVQGTGLAAPGEPGGDLGPAGLGVRVPGVGLSTALAPVFAGHLEASGEDRLLQIVGGALGSSPFNGRVRVVDGTGEDVTSSASLVNGGASILLTAPEGGWVPEHRIELLPGLVSTSGAQVIAPLVLRALP